MEIEQGKTYTSYDIGSKAKVISIHDNIVTYKIVYHPNRAEIVGNRGKERKHNFITRTRKFNVSYKDHKQQLKI